MDMNKIKEQLRPDTSVKDQIDEFISQINNLLKQKKIKAVCVSGGSVAKGTFIKGDFDIDLFVKFDYSYKEKNLSDMLESAISVFRPTRVHGSRDYFHFKKDGLKFEIVPVLDITEPEKALNVTDMSPLHVDWVKKNLKKGQDDEIRLAKKFCKSIGVYGAESHIKGFSGHVLDILVVHYGSFMGLLENAAKWKNKTVIDIEKHFKNSSDILFILNQSKIRGPLIVVDPILNTRNAASALSYEKYALFKKKAKEFLRMPSEKYFEEVQTGITYLKKKYKKNLYVLTLKSGQGKSDVVGGKILKAFKFMKSSLANRGFEIKQSGWTWNNKQRVLFWFVFKEDELPEKMVVPGPPVDMEEHVKDFREHHKKCFEKNKHLFAEIEIEKRTPEENINEIAKKEYFKEKIEFLRIEK
ncbi:CCA tRNA nucleotidyltransferase [Candidatus Woesearchaeota archaeon]|nr:CCA tRNA nucleotidyltransferase [Candidatus Woesearchaeota archaeon]